MFSARENVQIGKHLQVSHNQLTVIHTGSSDELMVCYCVEEVCYFSLIVAICVFGSRNIWELAIAQDET
jgi:hypothetical protein